MLRGARDLAAVAALALAFPPGKGHKTKPPPPQAGRERRLPASAAAGGRGGASSLAARCASQPRGGRASGPAPVMSLVILGGLSSGGLSTNRRCRSRHADRTAHVPTGSLLQATHDAAGAAGSERGSFVIGGGTATPAGSIQIERAGKRLEALRPAGARADAGAVTIGHTVYVVGGYDGSALNAEVVLDDRRPKLPPGRRASRPRSLPRARRPRLADLRLRRPRRRTGIPATRSSSSTRPGADGASGRPATGRA